MGNNTDTQVLHPTFQYRAQLHQQLAVAQLLTKPNLLYQEPFDCLVIGYNNDIPLGTVWNIYKKIIFSWQPECSVQLQFLFCLL